MNVFILRAGRSATRRHRRGVARYCQRCSCCPALPAPPASSTSCCCSPAWAATPQSPCLGPARRPQRHTAPPARCGAILSTMQLRPGTAGAAGVFHQLLLLQPGVGGHAAKPLPWTCPPAAAPHRATGAVRRNTVNDAAATRHCRRRRRLP